MKKIKFKFYFFSFYISFVFYQMSVFLTENYFSSLDESLDECVDECVDKEDFSDEDENQDIQNLSQTLQLSSISEEKKKLPKYRLITRENEPNYETLAVDTTEKKAITSIVFYNSYKGKLYALVQRRSAIMTHKFEICGVGGRVDHGETWLGALKRELLEEAGIQLDDFNIDVWTVYSNLNDSESKVQNVVFAAQLPYLYPFKKPSHLEELDQSFFDHRQGEQKNYHKWLRVDNLLNGKEGKVLFFFKEHLKQFLSKMGK